MRDSEMTSTFVKMDDELGMFSRGSHIIHKRDLSDLGEPYLSAVKKARAERDKGRQEWLEARPSDG